MHTSDKTAPKPGTLVYKIDLDDLRPQTADSNTYCVVNDGSVVKVAPVLNPAQLLDYDPAGYQPSFPQALRHAAVRLREQAKLATEQATKFDELAGNFDRK